MVYGLLIMYILMYTYSIRIETKWKSFMIYFIPIFTLLVMILSLQNNVGTDYESYLRLARGTIEPSWIAKKSEFLFLIILNFIQKFNSPQLIFLVTALIQMFFLSLITFEVKKNNFELYIFFFLYFTLSIVFFNQFNGIRQYTAVYIANYAIFQLMKNKKILFVILIIVASLFHMSSLYILFLLIFYKVLFKKINFKYLFTLLFIIFLFSFIGLDKYIIGLLEFTKYKHYIYSNYLTSLSFKNIMTKIPKILIVMYSIFELKDIKISSNEQFLMNIGYLSLVIQVLSFSSTIIWRFYQFFDLFIIFPTLIFLGNTKNKLGKIWITLLLVCMLLIKILIIPDGEYLYKSILF